MEDCEPLLEHVHFSALSYDEETAKFSFFFFFLCPTQRLNTDSRVRDHSWRVPCDYIEFEGLNPNLVLSV